MSTNTAAITQTPRSQVQQINARYKAARRAISIINRLKPGAYRARHASRAFCNLNKIRAQKLKREQQ